MSGNTFGKIFKVTTWGESHGKALGVVIDGVLPGICLTDEHIQHDVDLRKPGVSEYVSTRRESDRVEILSGVFEGKTTGTPLSFIIRNVDAHPQDYEMFENKPRPGHADFGYISKYGIYDFRGGGRSSGRETVCRVVAGSVARKILSEKFGIQVCCHIIRIGNVISEYDVLDDASALFRKRCKSSVFCVDEDASRRMEEEIRRIREAGNSLGGVVAGKVSGMFPGIGEPVFEKADARIAGALMSIGGVKGVEFGAGFSSSGMTGSEFNDAILPSFSNETHPVRFKTNNCGGISGGITTGQDIDFKIAVRPTPSISIPCPTVDLDTQKAVSISSEGRHDPAFVIRVVPVAEAMVSLSLLDMILENNAISRI